MYKVLDIREYRISSGGSFHKDCYGSGGSVETKSKHYTDVICEDTETHKRERFTFYKGYESAMFGKKHYYGYMGDFHLLIIGDVFEIKETMKYPTIVIHYSEREIEEEMEK